MISALAKQSRLTTYSPAPRVKSEEAGGPQDQFTPSPVSLSPEKPAEKPVQSAPMSAWARGTMAGMAGLIGILSLTGCTGNNGPKPTPQVETQVQKEARQQLSQTLAQIERGMPSVQGESGQQQSEQITRQVMDAAKKYAQQSGKDGPGIVNDLRNLMQDHPALTITSMFALGTATGVGLEKLGLTDGVKSGAATIYQAAKDHPFIATGIALAAAGGTAYLIHQVVTSEGTVPAKPTGAQAESLEGTFKSLEERIAANPNVDAKDVNKDVMAAISKYQTDTGKPWEKVIDDVKAFAFEHPVLAATVVASAGVATGVVLERAGVPDKVASLAGLAFQGSKSAASNVGTFIKEHPVVSGAVAVGIASGVGYLAYNHFNGK
ncbi:hypothetical protein IV102_09780 [bacterium]|nr:hypothetical protein [bacterium]